MKYQEEKKKRSGFFQQKNYNGSTPVGEESEGWGGGGEDGRSKKNRGFGKNRYKKREEGRGVLGDVCRCASFVPCRGGRVRGGGMLAAGDGA